MPNAAPSRWILTGGTGFLGSNLLSVLESQDGEVIVVDRHDRRWPIDRPNTQYVVQDVRDVDTYRSLLTPGCVVVHMASSSYPGKAEKNVEADIQDNVLGSVRLANACADAGAAAFLFFSTGGALYGEQSQLPIPEDAAPRPKSAYGVMKLAIEHYLRVIHELRGMPIAIVRIGNPYGLWHTGREQGLVNVFLERMRRAQPLEIWGDGSQTRDYLFAEDAALAVRAIGRGFRTGYDAFNIGTGEERSIQSVLNTLAAVTGITPNVHFLPGRVVDAQRNVLDCTKIQHQFGWAPRTSFENGIRTTYDWIKQQPL